VKINAYLFILYRKMEPQLKQTLSRVSNLCSNTNNTNYFIFANGKALLGDKVYIKDEIEGWKITEQNTESFLYEIQVFNKIIEEYKAENQSMLFSFFLILKPGLLILYLYIYYVGLGNELDDLQKENEG